jgi:fumarate hydratase subunit alpha
VREIPAAEVAAKVADLCMQACRVLPPDVLAALTRAKEQEESPLGREILTRIIENARLAEEHGLPMCQDTGLAVVFAAVGECVRITGASLPEAVAQGVREGYEKGYLRKSVVFSPLDRRNTGDNTPPVLHIEMVPGESLHLTVAAKGAGSENMSRLKMMAPADGIEAVKRFVVQSVENAGASACPPLVVGVGLGGSFEQCALISKQALLRPLDGPNPDPAVAALEQELLDLVNDTGIGPMGIGGRITALAVNVETRPCHIASQPVAVNLQCHAARHARYSWE